MTNKSGVMEFRGKTSQKSLILLKKGKQYAISDPSFYARSFFGMGGIRAFIYTDRPIYRPGDEVSFKGIVRSYNRDRYGIVNGNTTVDLFTDEGKPVIKDIPVVISESMGTFNGSLSIPKETNQYLGTYNLILNYKDKKYSTEFSVDAYKKPSFIVKVKTGKKSYLGTDSIPVAVSAKYYYGNPLSGESVVYRVFRRLKFDYSPVGQLPYFAEANEYLGFQDSNRHRELILEKSDKLDEDGNLHFVVKPERVNADYVYTVIATVTSASSSQSGSASFSVNRSAFFIRVKKNRMIFDPGESVSIEAHLIAFDKSLDSDKLKSNNQ